MRNRKTDVFLDIAHNLSRLGTCDRKQVGALVVRDGRCVSWGYNGAPPGAPHCEENNHGWHDEVYGSKAVPISLAALEAKIEEFGCRNATHAEANALAFAARQGISTDGADLYVTLSPCEVCARLLIAAGIESVVYEEEYRDRRGIEILERAGVTCFYRPCFGGDSGTTRPVRGVS